MDEIDIQILQMLQEDARKSLSEVSSKINLSIPAVSERVRKLERSKAIKSYTAILNPEKFGKALCCFCLIVLKNKNPQNNSLFYNFINNEPDILECHCITGEYEYLLKIVTETTKSLEDLLARMRNKIPIVRTNTFITLSALKENVSIIPSITKN